MNLSLFNLPEVREFLKANQHESPEKLAIKFHGKTGFPLADVLLQLSLAAKAEEKLPTWKACGCVFTRQALEQATSETLAIWKAQTFQPAAYVDLTAGLGVDAWAMSRHLLSSKVVVFERDEARAKMLEWNFKQLGIACEVHQQEATMANIDGWPENALIYIDPDRRVSGQRSLSVKDWSPDLSIWIPEILSRNRQLLIKFSPMIDITWIEHNFPGRKQVYVLGKEREVKEVLVHFEGSFADVNSTYLPKTAVIFQKGETYYWSNNAGDEKQVPLAEPITEQWLFDPHGALIKAGLTSEVAAHYQLSRLSKNNPYLLGNAFVDNFPGRQFKILSVMEFKPELLKSYLKSKDIRGAGVGCRDFPETAEKLKQRFKLGESHSHYLAFTKTFRGKLITIHGQTEN